ncbi:hypothetical protein VS84_01370 [Vibrio cholerae]|nr:hypothetical protein VS84_01370 [Vibrio cholerae]
MLNVLRDAVKVAALGWLRSGVYLPAAVDYFDIDIAFIRH